MGAGSIGARGSDLRRVYPVRLPFLQKPGSANVLVAALHTQRQRELHTAAYDDSVIDVTDVTAIEHIVVGIRSLP